MLFRSNCLLKRRCCIDRVAARGEKAAEIQIGLGETGRECDGAPVGLERFFVAALHLQH